MTLQLKPQDIVIAIRLLTLPSAGWTFHALGESVGLGHNQAHLAYKRLLLCELANAESKRPVKTNLVEFLVHGIRYVFPPSWLEDARGLPTGASSPLLRGRLQSGVRIVWPAKNVKSSERGRGILPIHESVLVACRNDHKCYEILSVTEALRAGGAREREIAAEVLKELILGS